MSQHEDQPADAATVLRLTCMFRSVAYAALAAGVPREQLDEALDVATAADLERRTRERQESAGRLRLVPGGNG